jgi:hypothetical protein
MYRRAVCQLQNVSLFCTFLRPAIPLNGSSEKLVTFLFHPEKTVTDLGSPGKDQILHPFFFVSIVDVRVISGIKRPDRDDGALK